MDRVVLPIPELGQGSTPSDSVFRQVLASGVVIWGFVACLFGSLLGSLGVTLAGIGVDLWDQTSYRPSIGELFEFGVLAFFLAITVCTLAFPLLVLLLLWYRRLTVRVPWLEGSWLSLSLSCAVLAAVATLGAAVFLGAVMSTSRGRFFWTILLVCLSTFLLRFWYRRLRVRIPWLEHPWVSRTSSEAGLALVGMLVVAVMVTRGGGASLFGVVLIYPAAFAGILGARWLHPGLGPGAIISSSARVRLPVAQLARVARLALAITAVTVLVQTEMYLPCADESESCMDSAAVRGLPYPFWRRTFDPLAFGYDALVFGTLVTVAMRLRSELTKRRQTS